MAEPKDINEAEFFGFAKSYLSEAFPNPQRVGCPPDSDLQRMAEQPVEIAFLVVDFVRTKSTTKKAISRGAVHSLPADLREVLISDSTARAKWEDITPLARNEWICWVISVKKPETRRQHIERVRTELKEGMRRPCCWPGCPHR